MQQQIDRNLDQRDRLDRIRKMVGRSRAPATIRAYELSFSQFKEFCRKEGTPLSEADGASVALFIEELSFKGKSAASITQAVSAIAWKYQMFDRADPTKNKVVSALVAAVKRTAEPTKHKEPAILDHLKWLRDVAWAKRTFVTMRTFVIAMTLFGSCSRLDEIIQLQRKHITVHRNFVKLELPRSKTDQVRSGYIKYMPKGRDPLLCPVTIMGQRLADKHLGRKPEAPGFPACRDKTRSIGKSTVRENLKTIFKNSTLPTVTAHSFHAGFATAALEGGADASAVQLCGNWAEPRSMQSYVKRGQNVKLATGHQAGL